MIYFFTVLVIVDTAHNLSPMAMAWSRGDVREVMLRRWPRYILIPGAVLAVSLAAATQSRPVVDAVVTVYFVWNVWHFASQNYGLLRLLQIRRRATIDRPTWFRDSLCYPDRNVWWVLRVGSRCYHRLVVSDLSWPFCMAVTIVGMVVWPVLASDPWHWRLINLAIFAIPHWVSEIVLTSWASTHWKVFAPLILAAGCVGLLIITPSATGMAVGSKTSAALGMLLVCIRSGFGFVHFIYDGLIWRFRDPEVRETIGRTVLA